MAKMKFKPKTTFVKSIVQIQEILETLKHETDIFLAASNKFKCKLPRDKFVQSLGDVQRHVKCLLRIPGIEIFGNNNTALDQIVCEDFLTVVIKVAKQTHNVNEVSLKSFSLCEQRMRLGYLIVSYSLALGILARIYALSKAMLLISSRLVIKLKKNLLSHLSSSEIEKELSRFAFTTIKPFGFEEKDLSEQDDIDIESRELEDLGEVIQRDEFFREAKTDQGYDKLTEILIKNNDNGTTLPTPRIENIKNLRSFRIACQDVLKRANKSQKARVKVICTETVKKAKKWKVKGKNVKAKKEIKLAWARISHLLKTNTAETAARIDGYQSISDDENVTNTSMMEVNNTDVSPSAHVDVSETNSSNKQDWTAKKTLLNVMKNTESVKEMLSTWKQMLSGKRDDLSQLIPQEVSKKERLKIKNFLSRTSKLASITKPKIQVKKTARKVVSLIEQAIGR